MSTLGLAAIQTAGDKSGNLDLVETEIATAAKRFPWVSMITIGELAIHGPNPGFAEPEAGPTEQRLCALAQRLGIWLVPGSLYVKRGDQVFNSTPVIDPSGHVVARYDKMYPFLPYEAGITPGERYVTFDVPGAGRFGIVICYDMWFPEAVRTLAAMGAEVLLIPTMTNTIDRDVELSIARANAAINQCIVVDVNVAGAQGFGRSVFYGPGGDLIHECGAGHEVVALELDFEQVRRARSRGWHGLGQTLKSFRDMPAAYPFHGDPKQRQTALGPLGPLQTPDRLQAPVETEARFHIVD
ncbi:MAG: carbon-nitrogen hydrolase family protein [Pseudomonadota bacterium]